MFTENSVQDVSVTPDAPFVTALLAKLVDIDKNRINRSDDLVLRKAVFALIELVGDLEARVRELEGPDASERWYVKLEAELAAPTPDELRLGEPDEARMGH
ncbi:hypothetical protein JOD63_003422 [Microbacterium terrae]|uniref:Uncharacterized protein n=1 Tax=Microbacterium terrae TaxID=69369 RepID=A0A0M2HBX4_9MICO|nr:hypothetical protein [Microbacterium terrae]KJL44012.1 hypothetical protein RS81_00585 [Microbacterium terrae]MBP1079454.1 hypothetical protein [Microbacterium terrae]GLJ98855.1 hypothetical protein GCM10017594_20520 [Microbacterium terrae]